jgi:lysozyme family protein
MGSSNRSRKPRSSSPKRSPTTASESAVLRDGWAPDVPTTSFDRALGWVLKAEGGYYDGTGKGDPNPTMMGVTQKTYDRWRKASNLSVKPVRGIGMDEVASIYRVLYWTKGRCDRLANKSETIATIHMDACVNHGVASPNNNKSSGAIELFQRAVGAEDDGIFGAQTWSSFIELLADDGEEAVADRYLRAREAQYRYLADKAPRTLGLNLTGWFNRLDSLAKHLVLGWRVTR